MLADAVISGIKISGFGNTGIDLADSDHSVPVKSESGCPEIPDYFRDFGVVVQHCRSTRLIFNQLEKLFSGFLF